MTEVRSAFRCETAWLDCESPPEPYNVPERVGFDGILSSQRNTAEDDEDEDEVGEVRVVDEVVAGDS